MTEDTHYIVLKMLEQRPQVTPRELAHELGLGLGADQQRPGKGEEFQE